MKLTKILPAAMLVDNFLSITETLILNICCETDELWNIKISKNKQTKYAISYADKYQFKYVAPIKTLLDEIRNQLLVIMRLSVLSEISVGKEILHDETEERMLDCRRTLPIAQKNATAATSHR